eukprot:6204115-Pleurochrysis_carterae.AAC.3
MVRFGSLQPRVLKRRHGEWLRGAGAMARVRGGADRLPRRVRKGPRVHINTGSSEASARLLFRMRPNNCSSLKVQTICSCLVADHCPPLLPSFGQC